MLRTAPIENIRTMIYREGKMWYGVAIELNIVEAGDTFEEVSFDLDEALQLYIENARLENDRLEDIHHEFDKEHEDLWKAIQGSKGEYGNIYVHKATTLPVGTIP